MLLKGHASNGHGRRLHPVPMPVLTPDPCPLDPEPHDDPDRITSLALTLRPGEQIVAGPIIVELPDGNPKTPILFRAPRSIRIFRRPREEDAA